LARSRDEPVDKDVGATRDGEDQRGDEKEQDAHLGSFCVLIMSFNGEGRGWYF
jgi:hypothetical protein